MTKSDWIKVLGILASIIIAAIGAAFTANHSILTNADSVVRLEKADEKQDVRIDKLEEKTSSIDSRLGRIETQQMANTKLLEKLDTKMDKVLSK
tara:strand:+ start:106 stop:387 length:282 start_codon:yes stop_codon:yes gene_type:complete